MPSDDHQIAKKLGTCVRRLRTEKGLSQIALAEKADLQPNYIGEIERAEKFPSIVSVVRIARGLGMTAGDLLREAKL
jgi:XRE family transcriptional regulator, regulator of sulfur utilization